MNYEDFPILTNTDYALLKQKLEEPKQDREKAVTTILYMLNTFYTCCLTTKKINTRILKSINDAKQICAKHQNNLSALFNVNIQTKEIESLNLFAMLKKLLTASSELSALAIDEDKIYYKKIFIQTSKELILSAAKILSDLQDSNIITFNYM